MNLIPRSSLFDFDNIFDRFWAPSYTSAESTGVAFTPRVDVKEEKNNYLISAELPGVEKDNVHVALDNGVLTIEAESQQEDKEEKDGQIIRQERRYGKFMRSFNLGSNIQESDIHAKFKNGVLTLKVPKAETRVPESRRINIQ